MTRNEQGFDENGLLEGEIELWRNRSWRVTNFALEEVPGENSSGYWIRPADLHWDMWPAHMKQKNWVNHDLFMEALAKARELHPRQVPA